MRGFFRSGAVVLFVLSLFVVLPGCGRRPENPPPPRLPIQKEAKKLPMDALLESLASSGLAVEEYQPGPGEKELLQLQQERFEKGAMGGRKEPIRPVESVYAKIDGVKVQVSRYGDPYEARTVYEKLQEWEKGKAARAKKGRAPYFRTTAMINGTFILLVRHWEAGVSGGKVENPRKVEIDETALGRIKAAFEKAAL
jgi:hypothetical protein